MLATTGTRTTRLGFGCSGIAGGLERRRSLALLEAAYDAGIRHFDVAPMYGYGTAEEVLGQFLQRHADATVTTKFGLEPDTQGLFQRTLRSVAKRSVPAMFRRKHRTPTGARPALRKAEFTRKRALQSVERSLRLLRRERIDLFLMHECTASELQDPGLLEALQSMTAQRRIGTFGVGSTGSSLPELLAEKAAYCPVVQSEWSAFQPAIATGHRTYVTHRALQCPWGEVLRRLLGARETLVRLSEQTNCDLADARAWPRLLLRAALVINVGTVALFSTSDVRRIQANCDAATDPRLDCAAERLHRFLNSPAGVAITTGETQVRGQVCGL